MNYGVHKVGPPPPPRGFLTHSYMYIHTHTHGWSTLPSSYRLCRGTNSGLVYIYSITCLQRTIFLRRHNPHQWIHSQNDVRSAICYIIEPVMKGHLSCRDNLFWILMCLLKKTGFTVYKILSYSSSRVLWPRPKSWGFREHRQYESLYQE